MTGKMPNTVGLFTCAGQIANDSGGKCKCGNGPSCIGTANPLCDEGTCKCECKKTVIFHVVYNSYNR